MHPLGTALMVLGYGLALPIMARLGQVKATSNRLALFGHQVGIMIALVAWAARGRLVIVLVHLAWLAGVRIWFGNRTQPSPRR